MLKRRKKLLTLAIITVFVVILFSVFYKSNKVYISYYYKDVTRSEQPYTLLLGSSSIARLPTRSLIECISAEGYGFPNGETEDIKKYLKWSYFKNIDKLLIYIGENDIARGEKAEQTFAQVTAIISQIQEMTEAPIGIITLKFSPARQATFNQIQIFNDLAETYYANDESVQLVPYHQLRDAKYYIADGIHLNQQGTRQFINLINQFCRAN